SVKKILISVRGIYTQKVEVKFLFDRIFLAYNRIALTAFAVFLLSFFVRTRHKEFFSVGCRSPPPNLDFSKNSDWRERYGLQQSQRRKKMAVLERSRRKEITELRR